MNSPAKKPFALARVDFLLLAVAALRYKAHTDAAHSDGCGQFEKESTPEWEASLVLEKAAEEARKNLVTTNNRDEFWRRTVERVAGQANQRGLEGLKVVCKINDSGSLIDWEITERTKPLIEWNKTEKCKTCGSVGFGESALGPDRCSFCDGSEGGQG